MVEILPSLSEISLDLMLSTCGVQLNREINVASLRRQHPLARQQSLSKEQKEQKEHNSQQESNSLFILSLPIYISIFKAT